jgi:hypothetical protein
VPEPSQESEGNIYVLGVSMWPLSAVFMYKYMNAHFAGLIDAPQLKMTVLSMFYKNGSHKYHTANKKWRD